MNKKIETWIKQFVISKVEKTYISDNIVRLNDKKSSCIVILVDGYILLVTEQGITSFKERKGKWKACVFENGKEVTEMEN